MTFRSIERSSSRNFSKDIRKPGTYKNEKPINITGIDKTHIRSDCNHGSIVNGVREHIFYSCALDKPPGHKTYKEPRIETFKRKKSVLSQIIFYSEDGDYTSVDFNGKTISFTCQLVKI